MSLEQILLQHPDPYLHKTWGELKIVEQFLATPQHIAIRLNLPYPAADIQAELLDPVRTKLQAASGIADIRFDLSWRIDARACQPGVLPITGVKNVIAVASGKGGVGKSTTAVNLAVALSVAGARVGLLDADIYGPNQPQMLGVTQPIVPESKSIPPVWAHGIQTMSMGYLVAAETPMVWRGPMVSSALQQLARETAWDPLDYLLIDMPPGTGDIALTLAQKIPVSGAVLVTTPQDIALLDVRKGLEMFKKVSIPLLGVIENMSVHVCEACGHASPIFGEGGAEALSQACGVALLGQLPLARSIRTHADAGVPIVIAEPTSAIAEQYRTVARKIAIQLLNRPKSYASKFPKIVRET
ncbi:MAG: iron-sulfur cluster carrier protein ApbC [Gammaproteobacteria bacterium]